MSKIVEGKITPGEWRIGLVDGSGGVTDEAVVRGNEGYWITSTDPELDEVDDEVVVWGGSTTGGPVGVLRLEDAKAIVKVPQLVALVRKAAALALDPDRDAYEAALALKDEAQTLLREIEG
ncbi:MAG TPA: hypothetical protein VEA38_25465 [Terriglobales bacterium]|nr:hypothetical protein [Terriglobales bacterium]